jgi:hypothetical protein
VAFVRARIEEGKPVGAGIFVVGQWWKERATTPREVSTGSRIRIPLQQSSSGKIINFELGEFVPYHPADESQREALRRYFDAAQKSHGILSQYDFDEYYRYSRPLDAVTEEEIAKACTCDEKRRMICPKHAVVITGYDDETETLEFKNSWGTDWKHEGYGYMSYKYFRRFQNLDTKASAMIAYRGGWFQR